MTHRMKVLLLVAGLTACTGRGTNPPPLCVASAGVVPNGGAVAKANNGQIRWIGGPTVVIERGGLRVITDPMLGPRGDNAFVLPMHPSSGVLNAPIARYTAPPPVRLDGLDAILVSHTHADHVDATAERLLPKDCPVIVAAAGADAMRAAGFQDVRALDWGESVTIQARGTRLLVRAVPAHHAHEAALEAQLGRGNGYVLEWQDPDGRFRIYWTGDAVLSDETRGFGLRNERIDLLLPHMGGVGGDGGRGLRTMNADEAMTLFWRVDPRLTIPIHHTTFAHYREPIEALQQRVGEAGQAARFHFLREGETFPLPASF